MLNWFGDHANIAIAVLCTAGLALGVLWWNTGKRKYGIASVGALALAILVFLSGFWIQTDNSLIEHALNEMSAGTKAHNVDRIFAHISDRFQLGTLDKQAFRGRVEDVIRNHGVDEVVIWDFVPTEISREKRAATVEFDVKVRGDWSSGAEFYHCKARFVLDPDNQWRLAGFQLFNPHVNTSEPIAIPGF